VRRRAGLLGHVGVAEFRGPLIRTQRFDLVSVFFEEDREVESPGGVAALICPPETFSGANPIALLHEQRAEVACSSAMTELIGSAVNRYCCSGISLLLKHNSVVERPLGLLGAREITGGGCCLAGGCAVVGFRAECRSRIGALSAHRLRINAGVLFGVAPVRPRSRPEPDSDKRDQEHDQSE
jgi:hypothetical protein